MLSEFSELEVQEEQQEIFRPQEVRPSHFYQARIISIENKWSCLEAEGEDGCIVAKLTHSEYVTSSY